MSKLYAIRQTGKSNYWYDFVEDFTSSELDRNCISNNFAYVKECQNNLDDLNPAWKNSEIVEFREFAEKDDFEDLYYKSLEQRADLEAKLAESEKDRDLWKTMAKTADKLNEKARDEYQKLKQQLAEKDKTIMAYEKIVEQKDEEINFANRDKTCIVKQLNDPNAYVSLEDYKRIEQKLAEKDKEIEKWKSMAQRSSNILDRFNYCGESTIYNTTREQEKSRLLLSN